MRPIAGTTIPGSEWINMNTSLVLVEILKKYKRYRKNNDTITIE